MPAPIAFFIYCLRGGGAERVVVRIANALAQAGRPVIVVTELGPETDQYVLLPQIQRVVVGASIDGPLGRARAMIAKVRKLRRFLRDSRPAALIAFMTRASVLSLAAGIGTGTRIIIAERNDPRLRPEPRIDRVLRRLLYPRATLAVAQTPVIERVLRDRFGARATTCIANPCEPAPSAIAPSQRLRPYALAMGRLVRAKGFDVLIEAWSRSSASREMDLVIAGKGEENARLQAKIVEHGLGDSVHLIGHVENPYPLLSDAALFVLSSRYEGFPNVVLEAMSLGRPVICTELSSGAHAFIEDDATGLIVPQEAPDMLARAIDRLTSDPALAAQIGEAGRASVAQFSPDVIAARWAEAADGVALEQAA